jgi:hypothetical protein
MALPYAGAITVAQRLNESAFHDLRHIRQMELYRARTATSVAVTLSFAMSALVGFEW